MAAGADPNALTAGGRASLVGCGARRGGQRPCWLLEQSTDCWGLLRPPAAVLACLLALVVINALAARPLRLVSPKAQQWASKAHSVHTQSSW